MTSVVQCEKTRVSLRVPGRWKSVAQLKEQLPEGFGIDVDRLCLPGGRHVEFGPLPADSQFPSIFRQTCLHGAATREELRIIDSYTMNATVACEGGSYAAARQLLDAGAALVRAGGAGVFIDNSLMAHSGRDWTEMAASDELDVLFFAFVCPLRLRGEFQSFGMHIFGQPDGVLKEGSDNRATLRALESLLRELFHGQYLYQAGGTFRDPSGRTFHVRAEPCTAAAATHPIYNPHGRLRLEPCDGSW